jgi:exonuclease SbcD
VRAALGAVENRARMDELSLFRAFHREIKGAEADADTEALFLEVLRHVLEKEGERREADSLDDDRLRAV